MQKLPSVLVHEHVLVDFVGADRLRPGRYDRDEVSRIARPKLEEVKQLGCQRLLDRTPNFLGRDPELLARLSNVTGVEIWSNTGLYGAAAHKFVPSFARSESATQLAKAVDRGDAGGLSAAIHQDRCEQRTTR